MSDERLSGYCVHNWTNLVEPCPECEEERSFTAPSGPALWEAYGPSRMKITFDHESHVGPTENNDVCGPLCVVGGDTDEESLLNAQRIAALLNEHGLRTPNKDSKTPV